MATRQYIGARYVPKFFENPNGTCEWLGSSIGYEALTIVTYLNNSFTSKKTVPAGIDITNTEYWVNTGNFNAQVEEYKEEVNTLSDKVDECIETVETVSGLIPTVKQLSEDVDDIKEELTTYNKKVDFQYGDVTFIRHNLSGYVIDVVKIPKVNQDGSYNKPIVKATLESHPIEYYAKNTQVAVNAGFISTGTNYSQLAGDAIAEGTYVHGATLTGNYHSYLAIDDNGEFVYLPLNTDVENCGYDNVCGSWHPMIQNGVISPLIDDRNDTSQQNIGYDSDNYYAFTTSYHCPLTTTQIAQWILTNYPTINTVFGLDSGGSTSTTVGGTRVNNVYDTNFRGGRPVACVICFPVKNTGNINTVASFTGIQERNNEVVQYYKDATVEANGFTLLRFTAYRIGQLVVLNGGIRTAEDYDGTWKGFDLNGTLPDPISNIYAPLISHYSGTDNGRFEIDHQSTQMSTVTHIEVKCASGANQYDFNVCYLTQQTS